MCKMFKCRVGANRKPGGGEKKKMLRKRNQKCTLFHLHFHTGIPSSLWPANALDGCAFAFFLSPSVGGRMVDITLKILPCSPGFHAGLGFLLSSRTNSMAASRSSRCRLIQLRFSTNICKTGLCSVSGIARIGLQSLACWWTPAAPTGQHLFSPAALAIDQPSFNFGMSDSGSDQSPRRAFGLACPR